MSFFSSLTQCLGRTKPNTIGNTSLVLSDFKLSGRSLTASDHDIANSVLPVICTAEKPGKKLEYAINDIVGEQGWTENRAAAVLSKMENAIKNSAHMSQMLREALDKSIAAAVGFARDHPQYCVLLAIGVLVAVGFPWVIEALGFAELGPIEGSFAAWWQSRYAGFVPKGSLFAFFQRLGMTWGK